MSSLEQLPKSDNQQIAEFNIERGETKVRASIPVRAVVKIAFGIIAAVLYFFLYGQP